MPRSLYRWTTLVPVGTGGIDRLRSLRFMAQIEWWDPCASTTFISWMLVSNVSVLVPNPWAATLVRRTPGNPASSTNFAATKEACAPGSKTLAFETSFRFLRWSAQLLSLGVLPLVFAFPWETKSCALGSSARLHHPDVEGYDASFHKCHVS